MNKIKFVHINIIAKDWKKLAQFYVDVFGCEPVYPERDLSGEWIDKLTNISNVKINGKHLKLPGYKGGPTIEIFEYNKISKNNNLHLINDKGFSHIAFYVDNVEEVLDKLIAKRPICLS
ncbi:VOC family protein [Bacteroidota bacterium]